MERKKNLEEKEDKRHLAERATPTEYAGLKEKKKFVHQQKNDMGGNQNRYYKTEDKKKSSLSYAKLAKNVKRQNPL